MRLVTICSSGLVVATVAAAQLTISPMGVAEPRDAAVCKGHIRGLMVVGPDHFYQGSVESVINGRRLTDIPTQASCPTAAQPTLAITSGLGSGRIRMSAIELAPGDEATAEAGGFQAGSYTAPGS